METKLLVIELQYGLKYRRKFSFLDTIDYDSKVPESPPKMSLKNAPKDTEFTVYSIN